MLLGFAGKLPVLIVRMEFCESVDAISFINPTLGRLISHPVSHLFIQGSVSHFNNSSSDGYISSLVPQPRKQACDDTKKNLVYRQPDYHSVARLTYGSRSTPLLGVHTQHVVRVIADVQCSDQSYTATYCEYHFLRPLIRRVPSQTLSIPLSHSSKI